MDAREERELAAGVSVESSKEPYESARTTKARLLSPSKPTLS